MSRPFDDALLAAAAVATKAPSSHNSQPWSLHVVADPAARGPFAARAESAGEPLGDDPLIVVGLDRRRALDTLAAHDAEMMMSCGMYLHLLLEALAAEGWPGRPIWRTGGPEALDVPGWPAEHEPLMAVALREGAPQGDATRLGERAARRITNRAPYAETPVADALDGLGDARTPLDPEARLRVMHSTEADTIRSQGAFVARHGAIDFGHDAAWAETHSYIRFTETQLARAVDGFPLTQLFGPLGLLRTLLMRIALAPLTMRLLKHVGYPRIIAGELGDLVAGSPATVTLSTADDAPDRGALLVAGGLMLDYWLRATDADLAMHPVSVILQHDAIRGAFAEAFGVKGRAVFFARIGRPVASFPPTPRRPAAAVIERL